MKHKKSPAQYGLFFNFNNIFYSSFGGHSGEGSVSASGFAPHAIARKAVTKTDILTRIYPKNPLLVFIMLSFV